MTTVGAEAGVARGTRTPRPWRPFSLRVTADLRHQFGAYTPRRP